MNDIETAAQRLQPYIIHTPLVESEALGDLLGIKVLLKLETLQKTGAFKLRGAMNYLLSLDVKARGKGVITASSGNHGLGMSLGARLLGIRCTVVMPTTAPSVKQKKARGYGAEVLLHGIGYDDAARYASMLAEETGSVYVPSFNHPYIIQGQGTILKEIHESAPDVGLVVAPIGGGGLLAGLLSARLQMNLEMDIIGAEPAGAASMTAAVREGRLVTLRRVETCADGAAVGTAGDVTFEVVAKHSPLIMTVSDDEIREAQRLLFHQARILTETAGSISVAALLKLPPDRLPKVAACILTGANMDSDSLKRLVDC